MFCLSRDGLKWQECVCLGRKRFNDIVKGCDHRFIYYVLQSLDMRNKMGSNLSCYMICGCVNNRSYSSWWVAGRSVCPLNFCFCNCLEPGLAQCLGEDGPRLLTTWPSFFDISWTHYISAPILTLLCDPCILEILFQLSTNIASKVVNLQILMNNLNIPELKVKTPSQTPHPVPICTQALL